LNFKNHNAGLSSWQAIQTSESDEVKKISSGKGNMAPKSGDLLKVKSATSNKNSVISPNDSSSSNSVK